MIPEFFLQTPISAPRETTAREAARVMRDRHVGCLLVTDAEGILIGIVTDRDLALRTVGAGRDVDECTLEACMTGDVKTLRREATIPEASRTMRRYLVRRLPIVDENKRPIGIITADDLIQHVADNLRWSAETQQTGFEHERHPPARVFSELGKE